MVMVYLCLECDMKYLGKKKCVNLALQAVGVGSGATKVGSANLQITTLLTESTQQCLGLFRKNPVRL